MKKRIVAALLVLMMVFLLAGCNSKDYEEAMELFDAGRYAAAEKMFLELGDYENAVDMVQRCRYAMAEDFMNEGEYQKAWEKFVALGGYKDAAGQAVKAARMMVYAYVEAYGPITKPLETLSCVTLEVVDGELYAAYLMQMSAPLSLDLRIGFPLQAEGDELMLVGTEESASYAAFYEAEAYLNFTVSEYNSDDELEWESFDVSGLTAQGTPWTRDTVIMDSAVSNAMTEITAVLEQVLASENLGLKMADIGFTSYQPQE